MRGYKDFAHTFDFLLLFHIAFLIFDKVSSFQFGDIIIVLHNLLLDLAIRWVKLLCIVELKKNITPMAMAPTDLSSDTEKLGICFWTTLQVRKREFLPVGSMVQAAQWSIDPLDVDAG